MFSQIGGVGGGYLLIQGSILGSLPLSVEITIYHTPTWMYWGPLEQNSDVPAKRSGCVPGTSRKRLESSPPGIEAEESCYRRDVRPC